ncbi:MAG: thiamine pyrophosphate-dependent enzyme [Desulfotignum sp.]|nr:thiamine pyrophosphate-dependent enzyme [Desulfotignum sp.]
MSTSRFDIDRENQWCPGCGNFGILTAMKQAFEARNLTPADLLLIGGIGQAGKTPQYLACNMLHGLHGRALAMATGAKIANHDLNVVVSTGDGDCYGEGGNHFLAAIRRNVELTVLVHNNQVYGLTKGQASPTTALGTVTKLQHQGTSADAFNPVAMSLAAGASFVARGFSGQVDQLAGLIQNAMSHPGFAIIDICQPCVSFNKINTFAWYKERVYDLEDAGHDPSDFSAAWAIAMTPASEQIATGVIFAKEGNAYHRRLTVLQHQPLVSYAFDGDKVHSLISRS